MDAAELAEVGAQLVELGTELKAKKAERAKLDEEIGELEKKLTPLVAKHTKLIADITGQAIPTQAPPQANPHAPPIPMNQPPRADEALKKRIIAFLQRAPEGTSAMEVADALKVDAMVVRQAMMEMAHAPEPTPPPQ